MRRIYTVTCKPDSGALQSAMRFDPDLEVEFTGEYDNAGNEVYEIKTQFNIDHILDQSPGVIKYE